MQQNNFSAQKKKKNKKHAELWRIRQHVDSERKLGDYSFSRHFQSGFSKSFQPLQIAVKEPQRSCYNLSALRQLGLPEVDF